jgi:hypothetical protein
MGGSAVVLAAAELRQAIRTAAAKRLGCAALASRAVCTIGRPSASARRSHFC